MVDLNTAQSEGQSWNRPFLCKYIIFLSYVKRPLQYCKKSTAFFCYVHLFILFLKKKIELIELTNANDQFSQCAVNPGNHPENPVSTAHFPRVLRDAARVRMKSQNKCFTS